MRFAIYHKKKEDLSINPAGTAVLSSVQQV
jgi:hypothetical protein